MFADALGAVEARLHGRELGLEPLHHGGGFGRDRGAVHAQLGGEAVEAPPGLPLDHHGPLRQALLGDEVVGHPVVVVVGEVEVAGAELTPRGPPVDEPGFGLRAYGLGQGAELFGRGLEVVLPRDLAHAHGAVGELHLDDRVRPEGADALPEHQQQQAHDHEQADAQGPAAEPQHGLAAGAAAEVGVGEPAQAGRARRFGRHDGDGAHSWKALLRKRWRTTSAKVLSTKVITNRQSAAR